VLIVVDLVRVLGGPFLGGMQRDSGNPDAPAGVLEQGQDVSLGAVELVGCEEVARQDRLGLGAQDSNQAGPVRRGAGSMPAFFKISHTVDAAATQQAAWSGGT